MMRPAMRCGKMNGSEFCTWQKRISQSGETKSLSAIARSFYTHEEESKMCKAGN